MRRPKIHSILNLNNNKGRSTYLIQKDNIDDVVINSKIKNLTVLPSGPTPPNPAELLGNGNLEKLITKGKTFRIQTIVLWIDIQSDAKRMITKSRSITVFVYFATCLTHPITNNLRFRLIDSDQFGVQTGYEHR